MIFSWWWNQNRKLKKNRTLPEHTRVFDQHVRSRKENQNNPWRKKTEKGSADVKDSISGRFFDAPRGDLHNHSDSRSFLGAAVLEQEECLPDLIHSSPLEKETLQPIVSSLRHSAWAQSCCRLEYKFHWLIPPH